MKASILLILALISFSAAADKTNFSKSLPACDDEGVKNTVYIAFEKNYLANHINPQSIKNKDWIYSLENVSVIGFNDYANNQKCKALFILTNKKNKGRIGFETIYEINKNSVMVRLYPTRPNRTLYDIYKPER